MLPYKPLRKCPVCGLALDVPGATPVVLERGGERFEFCSETCQEKFLEDPARYEPPEDEAE